MVFFSNKSRQFAPSARRGKDRARKIKLIFSSIETKSLGVNQEITNGNTIVKTIERIPPHSPKTAPTDCHAHLFFLMRKTILGNSSSHISSSFDLRLLFIDFDGKLPEVIDYEVGYKKCVRRL